MRDRKIAKRGAFLWISQVDRPSEPVYRSLSFVDLFSLPRATIMKTLCFSEGISYASTTHNFPPLNPVVLQLPTELIQAIMLFACRGVYTLYLSSGSKVALQHILLQVCRHWRLAALSYPPLWSDIRLRYCASRLSVRAASRRGYHQRHLVNALIATRDVSLRCHIKMELSYHHYYPTAHAAMEVLSTLLATSDRWVELYLDIKDNYTFTMPYFSELRGRFPSLAKLRLKYSLSLAGLEDTLSLADIFSDAPKLVDVSLVCDKSIKFVLPLNQLRCFKYAESTAELDLPDLAQATNLERFVFRSSGPQRQFNQDIPPIHNSSIKSLEITGITILDTLTLPATYRITFPPQQGTYTETSQFVSTFNNFVHRSCCKVTSLHITSTMSPDTLRSIVPSLSFLDRIFIICPVFQGLDQYRFLMDPDILPTLKKLSVELCFGACNGACLTYSRKCFQFLSDIAQARNLGCLWIHLKSQTRKGRVCVCEDEEDNPLSILLLLKDDPRVELYASFTK